MVGLTGVPSAPRDAIVLAALDELARGTLRRALASGGFVHVSECASALDVDRQVSADRPWALVIDDATAQTDEGALRRIRHSHADLRVLVVGAALSAGGESSAVAALRQGAQGFLAWSDLARLPECLAALRRGEYWVRRHVVGDLIDALGWSKVAPPGKLDRAAFEALTRRERQVCEMVAAGKSNREIADVLRISQQTVKHHLGSVFAKTRLSSRVNVALAVAQIKGLSAG